MRERVAGGDLYVKDARTLIVDRAGVTGEVRLGDVIIPPGEETAATEMIIVGESEPHPERAAQPMSFVSARRRVEWA
jgi:hypothetical protein